MSPKRKGDGAYGTGRAPDVGYGAALPPPDTAAAFIAWIQANLYVQAPHTPTPGAVPPGTPERSISTIVPWISPGAPFDKVARGLIGSGVTTAPGPFQPTFLVGLLDRDQNTILVVRECRIRNTHSQLMNYSVGATGGTSDPVPGGVIQAIHGTDLRTKTIPNLRARFVGHNGSAFSYVPGPSQTIYTSLLVPPGGSAVIRNIVLGPSCWFGVVSQSPAIGGSMGIDFDVEEYVGPTQQS